jgi:hypothetical protein
VSVVTRTHTSDSVPGQELTPADAV